MAITMNVKVTFGKMMVGVAILNHVHVIMKEIGNNGIQEQHVV